MEDSRYIDRLRAVLRDETNAWHVQSGRHLTARFLRLSDNDQEAATVALDRVRQAFFEIHRLFQKVK